MSRKNSESSYKGISVNEYGMSFSEWLRAAGKRSATRELQQDWKEGVDPAEYRT